MQKKIIDWLTSLMSGLSFLLFFKQVQARVTIFIQPVGSAEPAKDLTQAQQITFKLKLRPPSPEQL